MADTFKIYKEDTVIVEGASPLSITGVAANTQISAGTYKATRVKDNKESDKVDIPGFKTLPIVVTGITLNKTTLAKIVGETEKLTATVAPANATDKTVTWTTSDAKIATVGADGTVTAIAVGSATITAKAGTKTATCVVTVSEPANEE
ncbi:Ig-like domain-containing protein [Brochothrix thermosphacta]|uniref:Ig-like domain-containing protein n=1 Tax=Brochothrix thermosphacta TaxID=2756 RepID=UPI0039AF0F90